MQTLTLTGGSEMTAEHRWRTVYYLLLAGTLIWCGAFVAAPLLVQRPGVPAMAGAWLYLFFHPVCHQLDSSSFHLAGAKLAVCIRCSAIYGAFAVGLLLYPAMRHLRSLQRHDRVLILASILPMVLDVVLGRTGLHHANTLSRVLTGSLFGLVAAVVITPQAIQGILGLCTQLTTTSHQR